MAALVLLMISALGTKEHVDAVHQTVIAETSPVKKEKETASFDQIDTLLKEYVQEAAGSVPAPVEEVKAASHVAEFTEWTVRSGDALDKIARRFRTTVDEIKQVNGLKSEKLQIGQLLKVPVKSKPDAGEATPVESKYKYYTVKSGDSAWTIAIQNHMQVEELLKLNNLDERAAKRLRPGDQIRVE
ncbi:MAG: hypothetical protein A3F09_01105 [Chlamydiae bacterium RIFCSPHIGHO2_12_FULL_49_11]|nr:MAG: hypothetical protein A3F09_01105 [Chlamydiae bacterium RIFCSPHIGHO2_12_FULL_49_11]